MCAAEDQIIWTIFGTFWATNAILLVALFSTGKLPETPVVGVIVSGVGFALSGVWHLIQKRALVHLERFEELVQKFETKLRFPPDLALSARVNKAAYKKLEKGIRARDLIQACSLASTFLWGGALGYFVFTVCSR